MTKPEFKRDERMFTSIKAIKEKITITDKDFPTLVKAAAKFVLENEKECRKTPRTWKKENWKTLAILFIDSGAGVKFWNRDRDGFTSSDDFLYPEDKDAIYFLAFTVLKIESEKAFRVSKMTKRKSIGDNSTISVTSTRKSRSLSASAFSDDQPADDYESADEAENSDDSSFLDNSFKKNKAEKSKTNVKRPRGKKAVKGTTSVRKSRATIQPPIDILTPEQSEESDEDERTGKTIAGKHLHRGDPFEAARAFARDPNFSREMLLGKSGLHVAMDKEPAYEMPIVLNPPIASNKHFSFHNIDLAPNSMMIGDATEAGYREGWGDQTPGRSVVGDDSTMIDLTLEPTEAAQDDTMDLDCNAQQAIAPLAPMGNFGHISQSIVPGSPSDNWLFMPTSSTTTDIRINFSVTIASTDPKHTSIPHSLNLPSTATFADLLQQTRSQYGSDEHALERLLVAKSCIISASRAKAMQRELNLDSETLEASWRVIVKKILDAITVLEEEEVEVEFK